MDTKKEKEKKQTRGRPVKNVIEPIDASPEDIAKAIYIFLLFCPSLSSVFYLTRGTYVKFGKKGKP